jgi:PEP-CTERM motif
MSRTYAKLAVSVGVIGLLSAVPAAAQAPFTFSTGSPDGKIATASRPDVGAPFEIESADDFVLTHSTSITSATFTGLIPAGATATQVVVEIYRVFPALSDTTRTSFPVLPFSTTQVPARQNSPSDVELDGRDSTVSGDLTFSITKLADSFPAANSVQPGGIHPIPDFHTGGDGPVSGEEVEFDVTFTKPFTLPADHYFFVPQVELSDGNFLWLSAPKPITGGTGPFTGDLQSWTRDEMLDPDWLRVGTDIVGTGLDRPVAPTFNESFSLSGSVIPEPSTWAMMLIGFAGLGFAGYRRARKAGAASA